MKEKINQKYDGEFPKMYLGEILKYLNISKSKFFKIQDLSRSLIFGKKVKTNGC